MHVYMNDFLYFVCVCGPNKYSLGLGVLWGQLHPNEIMKTTHQITLKDNRPVFYTIAIFPTCHIHSNMVPSVLQYQGHPLDQADPVRGSSSCFIPNWKKVNRRLICACVGVYEIQVKKRKCTHHILHLLSLPFVLSLPLHLGLLSPPGQRKKPNKYEQCQIPYLNFGFTKTVIFMSFCFLFFTIFHTYFPIFLQYCITL